MSFSLETAGWEKDGSYEMKGQFRPAATILQKTRDDFGISLPWIGAVPGISLACYFFTTVSRFFLQNNPWRVWYF